LLHATVYVRRALWRGMRDPRRVIARLSELRQSAGRTVGAVRVARASHAPRLRQVTRRDLVNQLRSLRHHAILDITADRRGAPILVLLLVAMASLLAMPPGAGTAVGADNGDGSAPAARIAALAAVPAAGNPLTASGSERAFSTFDLPADLVVGEGAVPADGATAGDGAAVGDGNDGDAAAGAFAPDGTLLKPFAVDEALGGVEDQVQTYTVLSGDTLGRIASRFDLNVSTLFWANKLTSVDVIKPGQVLDIPPTDGVLYTVKEGDTIGSIAAAFHAEVAKIVSYNKLAGDVVTIGETIMVPDGRGKTIPTTSRSSGSGGSLGTCRTCSFSGAMTWPVDGGYFISQYFHSSHPAIDIAANYGTPVVAAASGKVIKTGWIPPGGYAIWISNGNGLYTAYYHLSYIGVDVGQYVSRGTRIGRVGQSGNATGPHLHFEVWIGMIWEGYRVNPLRYF
jgi:murein DD-endopeptidase MepM/ murein hydrolase activator NlpD